MRRIKLNLVAVLVIVANGALPVQIARADAYSCTFEGGVGPINPPVQAIVPDAQETTGDGLGVPNQLTDTDAGNGDSEATGIDGTYSSKSDSAQCAFVDDENPANSGVYAGTIESFGMYNNYVCGTGWAVANDHPVHTAANTTVTFADPRPADITDADYRIDFSGGAGALVIRDADTSQGESGDGQGAIDIEPVEGNCVTEDVRFFFVVGSFAASLG